MNTEVFLTELVKFIGYAGIVFAFAWKIAVRVTLIETEVKFIKERFSDHLSRVEKALDRQDKRG